MRRFVTEKASKQCSCGSPDLLVHCAAPGIIVPCGTGVTYRVIMERSEYEVMAAVESQHGWQRAVSEALRHGGWHRSRRRRDRIRRAAPTRRVVARISARSTVRHGKLRSGNLLRRALPSRCARRSSRIGRDMARAQAERAFTDPAASLRILAQQARSRGPYSAALYQSRGQRAAESERLYCRALLVYQQPAIRAAAGAAPDRAGTAGAGTP